MRPTRLAFIAALFACCAVAQTASTITTFAGSPPAAGFGGDIGLATAALLNTPLGTAVDSAGNVYIADSANSRVRIVYTNGTIGTFAGTGAATYAGDGTGALTASMIAPSGVAVDSLGNVYIVDPQASVVRKVSGGIITRYAGNGAFGYFGDGGVPTSAGLSYPTSIALDAQGNMYIADTSNHRIRKVSGGIITTVAGNGIPGYSGDGGAATSASLYFPQGVAVDSNGNIFIADTKNHVIRKVSGGTISTVAGTGGTAGFSGDHGPATAATLNAPQGVAVDSFGNIYIGDTANNLVRRVSSSVITTVAGTGASGYAGDGGPATSAQLNAPVGITLDPTGAHTYISDSNNNAIRVITNSVTSGVIPHFAAGSNYVTGLYVINNSASPASFTITFYNDAGTPITVPVSGGTAAATTTGASFTDTIPANGMGYYEAGTLTSATLLSGSATIQSTPSIVVQTLFRHQGAAATPYEAAVGATLGSYEALMPFDTTIYAPTGAQIYTGIAIANIDGGNTANVACVAKDNTGTLIPAAATVPALPPLGHWASYQFPAIMGKRGTFDCTSNTKIGVIDLRFIGTDAVATLPVILK